MRVPWKLLGLAGLAGVAAGGAVAERRRRAHRDYDPAELRERLHRRLAEIEPPARVLPQSPGEPPPAP